VRSQRLACRGTPVLAGARNPRARPRSFIAAPARHASSRCPWVASPPRRCARRN